MFGTKEYQHWNELYLKVHKNAQIRYTADIWLKLRKVLEKWLLYDQKIKLDLPSDIIHKYIKTVFELRNLQQRFFKKYKDKQTPMILHKDSNELPLFQFFLLCALDSSAISDFYDVVISCIDILYLLQKSCMA